MLGSKELDPLLHLIYILVLKYVHVCECVCVHVRVEFSACCVCVGVSEWLSSYALGLTTPGL